MKHQRQSGTEIGIASREAAEQIRMLIIDIAHTAQILEAEIATQEEQRARVHDLSEADYLVLARMLGTRRRNLMVTIASLEDRLGSIEKVRSREHATPITQPWLSGRR
jgi:hypothetical protein